MDEYRLTLARRQCLLPRSHVDVVKVWKHFALVQRRLLNEPRQKFRVGAVQSSSSFTRGWVPEHEAPLCTSMIALIIVPYSEPSIAVPESDEVMDRRYRSRISPAPRGCSPASSASYEAAGRAARSRALGAYSQQGVLSVAVLSSSRNSSRYQSPAMCRLNRLCVRELRRTKSVLRSLNQPFPRAPRFRTRPLILSVWFRVWAMRRTSVRFHLSLYRRFVKTLVLPSNSVFSAHPTRAPRA